MDLVVDANILIAALIKQNTTHALLFKKDFSFFTPESLFTEMEEHKGEILRKTKENEEDFYRVIEIFKRRIIVISLEELVHYLEIAEKICPDPDDIAYFALALKLNCPIWSNDKNLKKQEKIKVYSTQELLKIIG